MRVSLLLLIAAACASPPPAASPTSTAPASATATPAATVTPAASATANSTPTPLATSTPPATSNPSGGSVLIGEIPASKKFDPKPSIESKKEAMVGCYNKARASKPDLSGKLKLLILVNAVGTVLKVDAEAGGSANDQHLVDCLGDVLKTAAFPKPGGMATVVAPLVFRP